MNCGHWTTTEEQAATKPLRLGESKHKGQFWCGKCLGWRKEMK